MKFSKFFAFEGIDGSGKSTQAKKLQEYINRQQPCWLTREPTDNYIGQIIRKIFKGELPADHTTIAALYAADRLEHIKAENDGILAHLHNGEIVVCDRFYFSSYAYHSVYMPMDWVMKINELSASICQPAVHIFIDLPPAIAATRMAENREQLEKYEDLQNLENVYKKYKEAFGKLKTAELIVSVDGNRTPDKIHADIVDIITPFLIPIIHP